MRLVLAAALIAAATFVPLFLFGSLVRETLERDVAARSADERIVAARIAAASIDRELRSAGQALVFFGSGPTLRAAVRNKDARVLDRALSDLLQGRRNALGGILDPAGIVLAAPLARDLVGQDFSHRDYFRGAMTSAGPFVSEIFASASAGSPSVVAVASAMREGDAVLGVVVLTLAPADMLELLEPLRQVEGRDLVIVDAAGRTVAGTAAAFRPLAPLAMPALGAVPPNEPVEVAGKQRVVTAGSIGLARWTLYVLDDPSVVLMGERRLLDQLRSGGAAIGLIALVAAGAVVFLYGKTVRQRDALHASRAALARTNEALQEAGRHKSEFLASMSHELRTPLNAILGFSDLLREQLEATLNDRQKRYISNIRDAGEHLLGLINDVLDLSKVEAGRIELRPEMTTVEHLLAPTLAAARPAAEARGLTLEVTAPMGLALMLDVGRARQILYNLLSNAVKFTPPGGSVRLSVATRGADLVVDVSDTGIGIPADRRDRVFGTFERLHEGIAEASGTGLGLALTKRLVELHGGTIDFESEEGRGTTFRVRLPDVLAGPARADRLLIVEDEARDAELMVELAAKAGLHSEVVRTVAGACAAIRRSPPSAVVVDLRLPDGRGERVLEALKADPATRRVPVVVVTIEDDERHSRAIGADDHLTKPIDHARLDGWLRQVAARSAREEVPVARAAGR